MQGIASLYAAVGDTPGANAYIARVQNFYLLHRAAVPAATEVQHAWLLYTIHNDAALYPVLTRLDGAELLLGQLAWAGGNFVELAEGFSVAVAGHERKDETLPGVRSERVRRVGNDLGLAERLGGGLDRGARRGHAEGSGQNRAGADSDEWTKKRGAAGVP
ncbi:MAG: hypothetical protein ABSB50_04025 [Terracidiphilus sp.]